MKTETMKVRDFIKQDIDIDVYDDVCEELGIAFCGACELTEAGKKKFAEVMDYDIEMILGQGGWYNDVAIVHVDDPDDKVWKRKLRKAKEFFESYAGNCTWDEWEKWFENT